MMLSPLRILVCWLYLQKLAPFMAAGWESQESYAVIWYPDLSPKEGTISLCASFLRMRNTSPSQSTNKTLLTSYWEGSCPMSIPKPISLASEIKLSDWTSMSHVTTQNHRNWTRLLWKWERAAHQRKRCWPALCTQQSTSTSKELRNM